jgi:DNA-binding GntR family transcriptional regulator
MFNGGLAPGQTLTELALSQSLGVARSTIREALRVLVTDGLVVRMVNRTLAVRHLSSVEIEDIFTARLVLERAAARAAAHCPDSALHALAEAFEAYRDAAGKGNVPDVAMAHMEFHAAIVRLIGSERLAETEAALMRDLELVIAMIDTGSDDLLKEIEKHRILKDLFCKRMVQEAMECLEADLNHSKSFAMRYAADAGRAQVSSDGRSRRPAASGG